MGRIKFPSIDLNLHIYVSESTADVGAFESAIGEESLMEQVMAQNRHQLEHPGCSQLVFSHDAALSLERNRV